MFEMWQRLWLLPWVVAEVTIRWVCGDVYAQPEVARILYGDDE